MVSNDSLRAKLRSDDEFVVLKGLAELGGLVDFVPANDVLDMAMECFRYFDPEWRRQAVFSVVIHWAYAPAFPLLVELIEKEEDDDVFEILIAAIEKLGRSHEKLRCDAVRVLKGIGGARTRTRRER